MLVMQLVGLINGVPTRWDGQYVVEYDPTRRGHGWQGTHLITTRDPAQARQFADHAEAHQCWTQIGHPPMRTSDGKANRPLTAFTTNVGPLEKAGEYDDLFEQVQRNIRTCEGSAGPGDAL